MVVAITMSSWPSGWSRLGTVLARSQPMSTCSRCVGETGPGRGAEVGDCQKMSRRWRSHVWSISQRKRQELSRSHSPGLSRNAQKVGQSEWSETTQQFHPKHSNGNIKKVKKKLEADEVESSDDESSCISTNLMNCWHCSMSWKMKACRWFKTAKT